MLVVDGSSSFTNDSSRKTRLPASSYIETNTIIMAMSGQFINLSRPAFKCQLLFTHTSEYNCLVAGMWVMHVVCTVNSLLNFVNSLLYSMISNTGLNKVHNF